MDRHLNTCLRLAALALLAASGAAQTFEAAPRAVDVPSGGAFGSGGFEKALAGDLTGDGAEDVVALRGNRAVLLHGAAIYEAVGPFLIDPVMGIPANVSDAALFPRCNADLSARVFTAGSTGLLLWTWDGANGRVVPSGVSGPWTQATHVAVFDRPNWAFTHVVVHDAATGRLHPMLWMEGSGSFLGHLQPVQTGGGIRAIHCYDWNADGQPEIAAVHQGGAVTYSLGGTSLAGLPGWLPDQGRASVLKGGGADRLVWVTPDTSGAMTWAYVLDAAGLDGPIDLGMPGATAVTTGSVTPIPIPFSIPTLCVARAGGEVRAFFDSGGTPTFSQGSSSEVFASGALSVAPEALILADLDHDGDGDVFAMEPATSEALILSGDLQVPSSSWMDLDAADTYVDGQTGEIALTLTFGGPAVVPDPPANKLEILAWPWDLPPGGTVEDGVLVGEDDGSLYADVTPSEGFQGTIQIDGHHLLYVLEYRLVRDVPGEPRRAYPSAFVGYTSDEELYGELIDPPGAGAGSGGSGPAGAPPDPEIRGGIVPIPAPPPFPDPPMDP